MKKLLIIITLFVSSFFLVALEDVKATTYTKELDFSLIEDTITAINLLNTFIATDTSYSDNYIIYSSNGELMYYILPLDYSPSFKFTYEASYIYVKLTNGSLPFGRDLSSVIISGSSSSPFYINANFASQAASSILYSNFDLLHTTTGSHKLIYTYNDFSYTHPFVKDTKFLTTYDMYIEYQKFTGDYVEPEPEENPHQEEIEKVTNFYTMVIEKIEYLANEISNNYILLFVIGIFIVIFVFLLIFRRFL